MKEIKATAPTRKELYHDYKRLSDENNRLREIAKIAFTKSWKSREYENAWYEFETIGEQNK